MERGEITELPNELLNSWSSDSTLNLTGGGHESILIESVSGNLEKIMKLRPSASVTEIWKVINDLKYNLKTAVDLEANKLSIGELISHLLRVNNIADIG